MSTQETQLTQRSITDFVDVLASAAPAPGGGSTAALSAALGTALTHMVAALTVGKEKYQAHETLMRDLLPAAAALKVRFIKAIDEDTAAFNQVSAVFTLPKVTDADKAARSAAMQAALKNATKVPFDLMQLCFEALQLTEQAVGKSNTNAASDLGVAALSLKCAVQGAWLNVLINVGGIKDTTFADAHRSQGRETLNKATRLADAIYTAIEASVA